VVRKVLALLMVMALVLSIAPLTQGAREIDTAGVLSGYVKDLNGEPLPGVTVLAVNASSGESVTTISNGSGVFRLALPEGVYNLSAGLANFSADRSYLGLIVPGSSSGPYNFTLTEVLCSVSGFVVAGTPVFDVKITLSNAQYNYTTNSTSPFGQFDIRNIQPGVYVAYAEKWGYNPASVKEPLILTRGTVTVLNFSMEIQAAQLSGVVTNGGGKALADVKVVLTPDDGTAGTTITTNQTGYYSLKALAVGNYTLTFQKDDYLTAVRSVSLNPFESQNIPVTMQLSQKNASAVLFGYDLTHSFMLIAFLTGIVVVVAGLFINIRSQRKPDLLAKVDQEEPAPPKE
jgi:5-hydroxyisourate hydrolase-like protein (transthyretin family)